VIIKYGFRAAPKTVKRSFYCLVSKTEHLSALEPVLAQLDREPVFGTGGFLTEKVYAETELAAEK